MSNLYQLYQQWNEQIKSLYEWRRSENHKVLAWLMVAIMVGKDVCLDRLGLNLPHEAKPESVAQQFRRWMKNQSIDARLVYDPIAREILGKIRYRRVRVQLDRVQIKTRQNVLMLSVWYRQRAIPLAWLCLSHRGSSKQSHWQELLDYLQSILPEGLEVIILADREFGNPDRLRYVEKQGWDYAIRLKGNCFFYDPDWGQPFDWWQLDYISPRPGNRFAIPDLRLGMSAFFPFHLACAWTVGSKDPWFIATNLDTPMHALTEYARRFGCEELFSDLKKRGFNWEDSRIRSPERMARFLLALALLVFFLLALGRQLRLNRLDLELTSPSHRTRLSLFQTARRWLLRRLTRHQLPDSLFLPHLRRFA